MGAGKQGEKNMVTPNWGSFQRPNDKQIDREEEPQELAPQELVQPALQEIKEEIPEAVEAVEETKEPKTEQPEWGNFKSPETYQGEPDPIEEEGVFNYLTRGIATNASRLAEQFFGRRGNVEKMGKDILTSYPQAGGILGMALSELMGPERWERLVKGPPGNQQILPTSEQLKGFSQEATGGYTKPKTKGEEKFQGYTEDIGASIGPIRVPSGSNVNVLRKAAINNLGIPLAANAVKDTVKGLGFGEDKATTAKLATWTALSLLGNVNVNQYAAERMNNARNMMPNSAAINVPRLEQRLQAVANDPHLLHADPRSALARQEIANIQRDLANGQTSVRSLMTTYDGVNAAKRDAGLFSLNASDQRFARNAIDKVRNAVRDEIMEAGAAFPESINQWRSGIQSWAVIHQSNAIANWVDGLSRGPHAKILSGPASILFGASAYGGLQAPMVAAPLAVGSAVAYKGIQTAQRVWNDPNLSRYYWHAISDAQRQNLPAFLNNYNKLNKALEKSEPAKKDSKGKKDNGVKNAEQSKPQAFDFLRNIPRTAY